MMFFQITVNSSFLRTGLYKLGGAQVINTRHCSVERLPPLIPKVETELAVDQKGPLPSLEERLRIRFGPNMPTILDDQKPERDLQNFPRPVPPMYPEKTRLYLFPESWFTFFRNKTGVTGPYVFIAAVSTYMLSKEIYVIEHDSVVGLSLFIIITFGIKKFGPQINEMIFKEKDVSFFYSG